MVQEWKVIQHVYHSLTDVHGDELDNIPFFLVSDSQVLKHALEYFSDRDKPYVYPSKSYIVAIVYADYISTRWPEEFFYRVLDDPDLLYGNDRFFKRYSEDKKTYDSLIAEYNKDKQAGMLPDIREWAKKEFMDDQA